MHKGGVLSGIYRLNNHLFATVTVMPSRRRLNTDANKKALRALFFLYDVYKNITLDHMQNPRSTSIELNALYRNKLVPKINEIVTELNVGPTSTRNGKLKYEPTPFSDLFSIEDLVRESVENSDYFSAIISRIQSGTKDLLEMNGATEEYGSLDDAQIIIVDINRLLSSQTSSGNLIQLGDKPKLESHNGKWYVVGTSGRKHMLSKKGFRNGELLNALLDSWGTERSYESIFEVVNSQTTKEWNQGCLTDAMKAINKVVKAAGYRRLKITHHGMTMSLGVTDRGEI